MSSLTLCVRTLSLLLGAVLLTACGSVTITGGQGTPDGATPDDPATFDTPPTPDLPVVFDARPDLPTFLDRPVPFDLPAPRDLPLPPDVPLPPDITFPDVPLPPDITFPDVPLPPDITFPDVPLPPDVPTVMARCLDAITLTPGVTLPAQNSALGGEIGSLLCAPVITPRPSLWYRIAVPAGQVLTVTMLPTGPTSGGLQARFITACTSGSCLPTVASTGPDGRSTVYRWTNMGAASVDVFVAVNAIATAFPTVFDITATLRGTVTNSTCDRAVTVRDGTTLTNEDPTLSSTALAPCPGMAGGAVPGALFYAADVPAGQTLTASTTSSLGARGFNYIRVIPMCGDTTCLAASMTPSPTASTSWTNTSMASRRVVIAVTPAAAPAVFNLSVRIRPPPTNTTCAGATRLTAGTLVGENLSFARDVSPACLAFGTSSGPVLYYTARVGEGERLTVVARRTSSNFFQPLVRVIDGCTTAMCLASSAAMPMGGDSSRITWVNPGAARDVIVLVSSSMGTADGTYDLTTALGVTPYRVTSVAGACDTLTSPTLIAGAVGDDVGTASIPLPFPFRYFGTDVTAWSVSTNGYLQVWPTAGTSMGALGVSELPSATAPPSMIAPFWDDLEVDSGTASVRWATVVTPSPHLTVEWTNVRFCCGGGTPDRLTFQAKLFPMTNVIEFHYCSASPSPRATAGNASIGIQDAAAAQGLSWAIRRAGAAAVGTAVRFSPM